MRSIDIPQADSLDQVRRVMVAICSGARHSHAVRRATGISARHVAYALHAARLLGWLRVVEKQLIATPSGEALLQVLPGSAAERVVFERAVRACATMNLLAPHLLDPPAPDAQALARHMAAQSGIAFETARRRVQTMLSWRHRILLGVIEPLPTPRHSTKAPASAPGGAASAPRNGSPRPQASAPATPRPAEVPREGGRRPLSGDPRSDTGAAFASVPPPGPSPVFDRESRFGSAVVDRESRFGSAVVDREEHERSAFTSPRAAGEPVLCIGQIDLQRFGPLRSISAPLAPVTLLIGGAGVGKSALLESLLLLGDILRGDLPYALARRGVRLSDLISLPAPGYGSQGAAAQGFAIALDLSLPCADEVPGAPSLRYEVQIAALADGTPAILRESLLSSAPGGGRRLLVSRNSAEGTATLHSEAEPRYRVTVDPGPARLALSFVPRGGGFPAAEQLRQQLSHGLRRVLLHPDALRRPCSPLRQESLASDGGNLALWAQRLRAQDPARFAQWQAQACALLPEAQELHVIERAEDRHVYLALSLAGGLTLPAWRLPDSTLRALALTLLPCVAAPAEIFLLEEAEAGLPPELSRGVLAALTALPQSGAQLLLTAHPGGAAERLGREARSAAVAAREARGAGSAREARGAGNTREARGAAMETLILRREALGTVVSPVEPRPPSHGSHDS